MPKNRSRTGLGRRNFQTVVLQNDGPDAEYGLHFFLLGQQLRRKRCIGTHAGHADGHGQRCNGLRLAPLEKGQEHIGSHQQIQLILRIAFPQFAQRIHGIARAGPVKLDAADLHAGFSSYGKLREREARFAVRRAFGHGLVRRDGCGDQENFVQSQQLPRLTRGENMPQMRRIEAAAVNADPCHAAPLPCRCSFFTALPSAGGCARWQRRLPYRGSTACAASAAARLPACGREARP